MGKRKSTPVIKNHDDDDDYGDHTEPRKKRRGFVDKIELRLHRIEQLVIPILQGKSLSQHQIQDGLDALSHDFLKESLTKPGKSSHTSNTKTLVSAPSTSAQAVSTPPGHRIDGPISTSGAAAVITTRTRIPAPWELSYDISQAKTYQDLFFDQGATVLAPVVDAHIADAHQVVETFASAEQPVTYRNEDCGGDPFKLHPFVLRHLVSSFIRKLQFWSPVLYIHPSSFLSTLRSKPAGLLASILAFEFRQREINPIEEGLEGLNSEMFMQVARPWVTSNIEMPTVELVQAAIFCSLASTASTDLSNLSAGWQLSGLALRAMLVLRLDIDPDCFEVHKRKFSFIDAEIRRRLWHCGVILDKFLATVMDRALYLENSGRLATSKEPIPGIIFRSITDFTSPIINLETFPPRMLDIKYDPCNHRIHLWEIWGRLLDQTTKISEARPGAQSLPTENIEQINQYISELEHWFENIPMEWKTVPPVKEWVLQADGSDQYPAEAHTLKIAYFACHVLVHRPTILQLARDVTLLPALLTHSSFTAGTEAEFTAVELLKDFISHPHILECFPPMMSYFVFHVGLHFTLVAGMAKFGDDSDVDSPRADGRQSSGSGSVGSTPNPQTTKLLEKKAAEGFRTCFSFLDTYGKKWPLAKGLLSKGLRMASVGVLEPIISSSKSNLCPYL